MKKLSIVTSLYNSEPHLREFYTRSKAAAIALFGNDYEFIMVNDGSPDGSLAVAIELARHDENIKVVDLSRNFGHHKALMTGMMHADAELVFLIDCDLEEEPEVLLPFYEQLQRHGCDVVIGVQEVRRGNWWNRLLGELVYGSMRFFTKLDVPKNTATARLMTGDYVQSLVLHTESEMNIAGLFALTGYKQETFPITKLKNSKSNYTIGMVLRNIVNHIVSFSSYPLEMTFYTGLILCLTSFIWIIKLILQYYLVGKPTPGYVSIIVSIWFFSGLIIFFLGMLGIYIAKIFTEVKNRPYTVVRDIYTHAGKLPKN